MDDFNKIVAWIAVILIWFFFAGMLFYFYVYDSDEDLTAVEYNISENIFDDNETNAVESEQAYASEFEQADDQEDSANQGIPTIIFVD